MTPVPGNFTPSEPPQPLPPPELEHALQALDLFGVSFFGWPPENLRAVVLDAQGDLRLLRWSEKNRLPPTLQLDLNARSLAEIPRAFECSQVFLFAFEHLENLGDTPGFNDPVALCGRLYGPFDLHPDRDSEVSRTPGRFCVSRADVLEGLVRGEPFVFYGAASGAAGEPPARAHHLMLPAGLSEVATAVLAFPVYVRSRQSGDNGLLAAGLAYDVLARLQDDLRRNGVRGALPDLVLPVPSRRRLEAGLRSKGYEIRGDTAWAPMEEPKRSWLRRLFDGMVRPREELPPEAALPEFLRIARTALDGMEGWPSVQATAIRRQIRVLESGWPPTGPFGLTRILNADGGRIKDGAIVMSVSGEKGANAIFRVPQEFYLHGGPWNCPVEFQAEWLDDAGGGQICYVPGWQEGYKIHDTYSLGGTGTWKTGTYRIPNARLDGKLWHGDLGIYFHHKGRQPFRLRRVKVRSCAPDWLDASQGACRGWLDSLGDGARAETVRVPAGRRELLPFSGWVVDLRRRTAGGDASLVLRSEASEREFPAERRLGRQDLVGQFGGTYANAGFCGSLRLTGLPSGSYRVILRLADPETRKSVEHDSGVKLQIEEQAPPAPA
ncbi:MAG: hypothetical protein HYY18_05105 [Planctomycetes bacterium]|nr:hypothetical protein [Planctomycetota bacterium]